MSNQSQGIYLGAKPLVEHSRSTHMVRPRASSRLRLMAFKNQIGARSEQLKLRAVCFLLMSFRWRWTVKKVAALSDRPNRDSKCHSHRLQESRKGHHYTLFKSHRKKLKLTSQYLSQSSSKKRGTSYQLGVFAQLRRLHSWHCSTCCNATCKHTHCRESGPRSSWSRSLGTLLSLHSCCTLE